MARLTTSADTTNIGSVWYNSTIGRLQYSYIGAAWSAGDALITARQQLAGVGTQSAGIAFGGSSPSTVSCTEEYNCGQNLICTP
jgi:hypothetical protein